MPWYWGKEQDKAFDGIKNAVTSAPVLAYFGAQANRGMWRCFLPRNWICDHSLKEDHCVTYASRALMQAEQHDLQIEKELLALVFGLEHNHQYVYGRKVILYTDHNPWFPS